MNELLRRVIAIFLPVAAVATFATGLVYLEVQHDLRSGANEPQLQLAEDDAAALDAGADPATLVAPRKVDLARSLAPFVVVFDQAGTVLATDGMLDGRDPVPPPGVLDSARRSSPNTVTWQPRAGVRIAQATVAWSGGTVLAGRSLREVERRIDEAGALAAFAWLVGILGLAVVSAVAALAWPRTHGS
jgi:hypothetical protein